jgi:hypothetical protein
MKLFEGKTPAERNKLIFAMVLGVLAVASLSYMLFGGTSSPKKNQNANSNAAARNTTPTDIGNPRPAPASPAQLRSDVEEISPAIPVVYRPSSFSGPEPGRNIFAFWVPPVLPPKVTPVAVPSPTPPPPQILAAITPASIYARTGDFKLEVSGDKFTPETAIVIDGSPVPTRFVNAQQLSASVPGGLIFNDGARQIKASTPDGALYSNTMPLMVNPPPLPNYLYIGIIGKMRYNDTAVLKDKGNPKELLNVQRGDVLGGRFRVTSISDREIVLTDTSIHIKHTLPFVEEKGAGGTGNTRSNSRGATLMEGDAIPGIPNVPRYQPPGRADQQPPQQQGNEEEGEEIPGIPARPSKP